MKTLLALTATLAVVVGLTVAPSALADSPCPTDVHALLGNAQIDVNVGGTSTATFTIPAGCVVKVSLVSYTASAPEFTWENGSDEVVYDQLTENLGSGTHTLAIKTPDCYYQLDLVEGEVITSFGPYDTDPNNFYTPQGRLAASANGGTTACVAAPSVAITTIKAAPKPKTKPKVTVKKHKKTKAHRPKALPYTP